MKHLLAIITISLHCLTLCQADNTIIPPKKHAYQLKDYPMAASKQGRQLLKYLVGCALPENTFVETMVDNETYTFNGSMGLAPNWLSRGLSSTEQRWVSACIFARTNFFGVPVKISMRSDSHEYSQLRASEEEIATHTLHEGAFFGNMFGQNPVAYVCTGQHSEKEQRDLAFNLRVCAADSGKQSDHRHPVSYCDFIITGLCDNPNSLIVNGETFNEVIHIYLKPTGVYRQN